MIKSLLKLVLILLGVLGLFTTSCSKKPSSPKEKVRQSIKSLFQACQKQDFTAAAKLIIDKNADQVRSLKEQDKLKDQKKINEIYGTCYRINDLVENSEGYQFKKYFTEKETEGVWHVYELEFKLKSGGLRVEAFAFLPYQDGYVLGDIDYIQTFK